MQMAKSKAAVSSGSSTASASNPDACPHCGTDEKMVAYGPGGIMWRVCHGCGCHFLWDFDNKMLKLRTPSPDCTVIQERLSSLRAMT